MIHEALTVENILFTIEDFVKVRGPYTESNPLDSSQKTVKDNIQELGRILGELLDLNRDKFEIEK